MTRKELELLRKINSRITENELLKFKLGHCIQCGCKFFKEKTIKFCRFDLILCEDDNGDIENFKLSCYKRKTIKSVSI